MSLRAHSAGGAAAALVAALLVSCGPTKRDVERALDEANYCTRAEECVDLGPWCPFGCANYVNVDEVDAIEALREECRPWCVYKCYSHLGVACVDGVCEPIWGTYARPAAADLDAPLTRIPP